MSKTMDVEYDLWQVTKRTVNERIKFLYNNRLMADVNFLVADERGSCHPKIQIPCHKFVLAVASPVFFQMFEGKLAETSESIELPDCDSEGFLEFLRYLYCDEARLTGSCVTQVLYLAKKYMVPPLIDCCRRFLEENINAENVLAVLPQVIKLDEAHLVSVCWKIVDLETKVVLQSALSQVVPFNPLEEHKEILISLLRRDSLNVEEITLFSAVSFWAERACEKKGMPIDGKRKREIIGDSVIKALRFPLMSQQEFARHVAETKILTEREVIDLFMHFNLPERNPAGFSLVPRGMCLRTTLRCKRFNGSSLFWYYNRNAIDSIAFEVFTPVLIRGVRLFGFKGEAYHVKLKIGGHSILEGRFLTDEEIMDGYYGFDVLFEHYYPLSPVVRCIIEAKITGAKSYYGTCGMKEVVCENVTFRFKYNNNSDETPNGSTADQGQFAEILFHKQ